jgi:hypothetical protein
MNGTVVLRRWDVLYVEGVGRVVVVGVNWDHDSVTIRRGRFWLLVSWLARNVAWRLRLFPGAV